NVVLRRGASLPEIAASLETGGAIRSSSIFMTAAKLTGAARALKAGEYEFPSRASMASVLDAIRHGRIVRHMITIPEGLTSDMAVDILQASPVLVGDAPTPPEGAILPETYEVERGEDRAAVLRRMMDDHDKLLRQLWASRQPGLPFSTPEEAVTLASIVEKETGLAAERPRVAAVFVNRLRAGMRLGSDPTIIYGLTRGRPLGRGILLSELQTPTPYNTYLIDGLPPTPIANPGRAALAAVLDPPRTQELYFVADGSGGHVFAKTYEEHARNVARWRQVERQRAAGGN
ncbi:MAG: aminodeoxychorismate lyase, partial [Caulobacter sp.]|nr:aminodeoxychorismate lyase [Caulobacter sp.]